MMNATIIVYGILPLILILFLIPFSIVAIFFKRPFFAFGILCVIISVPPVLYYLAHYVGWTVVGGALMLVLNYSGFFRWFLKLLKQTPRWKLVVFTTIGAVIVAGLLGHYAYIHSDRFMRGRINRDLVRTGKSVMPGAARILEFQREDEIGPLATKKVTFSVTLTPEDFRVWRSQGGWEVDTGLLMKNYITSSGLGLRSYVIHQSNRGYTSHLVVDEQAGTVYGSITTWPLLSL